MGRAKIYPICAFALLAACFTGAYLFVVHEPEQDFAAAYGHLGTGTALDAAYQKWASKHEQNGGDANVTLALGWSKAFSKEFTKARGQINLNLITGSVSAHVLGLEDQDVKDVWLVDNQPGSGRSAKPEPGDKLLWVGTLEHNGDRAEINAKLGAAFDDFEVDVVVVTHSGEQPTEPGVLYGTPRLFQRLYTRARKGIVPIPAESPSLLAALGPRSSYANKVSTAQGFADLISKGSDLFFNETFAGNGRTCGTCHPAENNFTIDPKFIAQLPDKDPLFVAEFNPNLAENFEKPELMRGLGLILENVDGFDDLENKFTMRGVPHTLALRTSIDPPTIPFDNTLNPQFGIFPPAQRTGWSGDGAPGTGSLREFATGAVTQHFTRTLARVPGVDFRLPTDRELDALEAFQLSLGRQQDLDLSLMNFIDPKVKLGVEIFNRLDTAGGTLPAGKCALCHFNAGANINSDFFTAVFGVPVAGNANFGTAVNDLPNLPADLIDADNNPPDGGFGRVDHSLSAGNCSDGVAGAFGTVTPQGGALPPGLCEEDFNTPPLVEAADTAPFFHNNAVDTIEAAIAFYNDNAFNNSAGGRLLRNIDSGGIGIRLASTEVTAIAAFLRAVNALENINSAEQFAQSSLSLWKSGKVRGLLNSAKIEVDDAIEVLQSAGLHPAAQQSLKGARRRLRRASSTHYGYYRRLHTKGALKKLEMARQDIVEE